MQHRVCDRCQASADVADVATTMKTFVIPQLFPATNPTSGDVEVSMGVQITPQDLCTVCGAVALVQYGLLRVSDDVAARILAAFSAASDQKVRSVVEAAKQIEATRVTDANVDVAQKSV